MLRDTNSDSRGLVSENSIIANASKSEGEVSESRGCEIAQMGLVASQADDSKINPELDRQLDRRGRVNARTARGV